MAQIPQARAYERADMWAQHNARALVELACRVPDGERFAAREVNLQLDEVHLAHVRATAHRVVRHQKVIGERTADSITVYAALHGDALVEVGSQRHVMHPGQVLVCDVDRPSVRGFGHGLDELAVKVPRDALEAHTGMTTLTSPRERQTV